MGPLPDPVRRRLTGELVTSYVRETLDGVEPVVLDELYCTTTSGLGDGFTASRNGAVLAIWGDNLFKFAPLLGEMLARAVLDQSVPPALAH